MSAVAAPTIPTNPDPVGALSAAQTKAAYTLAYGGTVSAAADSVPASVHLPAALAILNRPKESSGREDWNVPRMESLDATLNRKPHLAEPPAFDTTRQTSALFTVSEAPPASQRENLVAKAHCPKPTANSAFPFPTPAERTPAA
jgi:hypothetical protein